jgi:hypothetical protein
VEYEHYSNRVPFKLPLPGFVSRAISAPLRFILGKERLETGRDVVWMFAIYLGIAALLSLTFLALDWLAAGGWVA